MFKKTLLATALAATAGGVYANDSDNKLESLLIVGDKAATHNMAGSGYVVNDEQIDIEIATDVNQMLKTVPGIYIREEDGAGLRPNIGIRSATSGRSSKITLLEDGVMIAPAPYSNPAAYYFPTMMRMSSIEVIKGAPLLRHGPQTTGGVINLVSTAIPAEAGGQLTFITDERGSQDTHAYYGATKGQWSYLVETVQRDGAGFKDIDRSERDSGFDISDYMVKLGWESDGSGPKQRLLLKAQYSEEVSNETYLGLTDDDFDDDPYRRYGLSSIDQMDNDHLGFSLTHSIELGISEVTTTLYRNEFARDWFKLAGGGSYITLANQGNIAAQGILDGTQNVTGLEYKHNNREYTSQGIQMNVDFDLGSHQLAVGGRVHEDEMDRYQPVEIYNQVNGSLVYQSTLLPTGSDNRLEGADAISLWLTDQWQASEALTINLALRYEDVESWQTRYADANRNTIDSKRSNDSAEWLPGVSFAWDIDNNWQLLGGVHRGFSPLGGGAEENQEPETSVNWEAGVRFNNQRWFAEAVGFYSDFTSFTENCSVGSPCSNGDTSGTYTVGEAVVSGLEFQLGTQYQLGDFNIPVDITYTYTDAAISEDNPDSGAEEGDQLKDVPENTYSARIGLEHSSNWNNYLVAKFVDEMCVSEGCNNNDIRFERTETVFVVDLISRYALTSDAEVFMKVENLGNAERIVSRTPDGARPNKARTVSAGITLQF